MPTATDRDRTLKLARRRQGVAARELSAAGIHRQVLSRLVAEGELERIARGLYRLPDHALTEHHGLAIVGAAVPQGVVCLLSALQFHGIGTQLPSEIWIAIDRRARRPALPYPPLRIVRYTGEALTEGVEAHRVEGQSVRVYSVAKTLADCFKYRNKIGLDVALEALREAWRARRFTMDALDRFAAICRVQRVMQPYLASVGRMTRVDDGLARSVQVRLARHARAIGVDPNLVLTRYAVERFLYRLSRSPYAERFVLKGALLLLVWLGETLRPTRDADLLGFGDLSDDALVKIFRDVCAVQTEPDAMTYLADSVRLAPIRMEDAYGGQRVTLQGQMGAARLRIQVDVGIGDAVTPAPQWLDYPSLLDLPRPRLRAYPRETVIAEKLHAMVLLGSRNSRMKDYFDVHALLREGKLNAAQLADAIGATFARRRTALPEDMPLGLGEAFASDATKQAEWKAFLGKNRFEAATLDVITADIRRFIAEPLALARKR